MYIIGYKKSDCALLDVLGGVSGFESELFSYYGTNQVNGMSVSSDTGFTGSERMTLYVGSFTGRQKLTSGYDELDLNHVRTKQFSVNQLNEWLAFQDKDQRAATF